MINSCAFFKNEYGKTKLVNKDENAAHTEMEREMPNVKLQSNVMKL